jgi:uncharacterized membrane protein
MEPYIILAIIAMLAYGVTAILYKIAPNIDAVSLTFFSSLSLTVITFIVWLLNTKKEMSIKGVGVAAIAGLVAALAFITYITAIKSGKVSIASTLRGLSFGVTVLLAVLFLGEKITLVKALGMGFAVIAIILLSL